MRPYASARQMIHLDGTALSGEVSKSINVEREQ